jgi:hypothetical protein
MNVRLLIDGIVRQTTILIAQLSTTAGVRAPLARLADQVFLDLAREIEAQGIGRKVVADMFGLALRSYQKKIQRLTESATEQNRTLWQAVLDFLRDGSKTRARIVERFHDDGEREVGAVLNDLVSSGIVYCTGRGDAALYGLSSEADLHAVAAEEDLRSVSNVVWLEVFRGDARTERDLVQRLGVEPEVVAGAVELARREHRLSRREDGTLDATDVVIPVGATEGWEAAVLDHFRAVSTAIATKASRGRPSTEADETGGATLTFSLHRGHPHEAAVRALLSTVRAQVNALWRQVADYGEQHTFEEDVKVTFYFGQIVTQSDPEPADAARGEANRGGPEGTTNEQRGA